MTKQQKVKGNSWATCGEWQNNWDEEWKKNSREYRDSILGLENARIIMGKGTIWAESRYHWIKDKLYYAPVQGGWLHFIWEGERGLWLFWLEFYFSWKWKGSLLQNSFLVAKDVFFLFKEWCAPPQSAGDCAWLERREIILLMWTVLLC